MNYPILSRVIGYCFAILVYVYFGGTYLLVLCGVGAVALLYFSWKKQTPMFQWIKKHTDPKYNPPQNTPYPDTTAPVVSSLRWPRKFERIAIVIITALIFLMAGDILKGG